ncbi:MAG: thioredoxin family protein [Flavobacteriaceae bacterium]
MKKLKAMMTYPKYRALVETLVEEGKSTGEVQSDDLTNYSFLNNKRMQRLDKKGVVPEEYVEKIKQFNRPVEWIVLTESWCGDAAQILPYINKVADLNDHIDLKIALRDEHLELMDAHLTNGGRAIPKLIMRDKDTKEVLDTFGPRPSEATKMVEAYKNTYGALTPEFKKDLQIWYTKNKGENAINDLVSLLD